MTQQEFFNRYTFNIDNDRLGNGSFGTVYRAHDNVLHRDVALKVSEVKYGPNGKVFSLKEEFDAIKGLPPHPNIAKYESLYSIDMPNGRFDYAVMQYYRGGNLAELMKKGLGHSQKEELARQLLEGIAFLHQHKVVHRDLKPANILVEERGGYYIPLITDFGLSKAVAMEDRSMFSNSFGGGTDRYSSPEQLQGKPLRFNTDLWAYGVVVYELFTGERLFEAGSSAKDTAKADLEVYKKIIAGDVGSRLSKVPELWQRVLRRCLVVNPDQRVKDAGELLAMVGKTSTNRNGNSRSSGVDESTRVEAPARNEETVVAGATVAGAAKPVVRENRKMPEVPQPKKRRKTWPWVVGGAALVVAVCLFLFILSKPVEKPVAPTSKPVAPTSEYVDLGLSSGTKWRGMNEEGFYTYDEAVKEFEDKLPSEEQWRELFEQCTWEWTGNGGNMKGPNGNKIYLPFTVAYTKDPPGVYSAGDYWTSTPYGAGYALPISFESDGDPLGGIAYRNGNRSVRLVQSK